MDGECDHLSLDEVRRALNRLRPADIVRLALLARLWASKLDRRDADDLLNEAFDRILSGRRPWRADLPLTSFLNGVMRSIAHQWRHEDHREALIDDDPDHSLDAIPDERTVDHDITDLKGRMQDALEDDPEALGVFLHILADSDRDEAQAVLGLDVQGYDTARRRMIRHMFTTFSAGWNS